TRQIRLRIDRLIINAHFVMQVRSCRSTCRTNQTNRLTLSDALAYCDIDLGKVSVASRKAIAVIDIDNLTVTTLPSRDGYAAAASKLDGRPVHCIDVLTFMIFKTTATERIPPSTNAAFELAENRPDCGSRAMKPDERFVHAHLVLEFRS